MVITDIRIFEYITQGIPNGMALCHTLMTWKGPATLEELDSVWYDLHSGFLR